MTRVVVARNGTGWIWWLQADLQAGCEVLVRGVFSYPDKHACRAAAHRLNRADVDRALSVQEPDGSWRLYFQDATGEWMAVSAERFADARASRKQLERVRLALSYEPGT